MIAIRQDCLQEAELRQFIVGGLPPAEFDSALSHLDDCDRCRSAAEAMEPASRVAEAVGEDLLDPLQSETACHIALMRITDAPVGERDRSVAPETLPQETLGPYRLLRPLGTGGMATVYLAEHERLRRQCAIKLLPRERVGHPGWLERFDREMTTVASLEHANVVRATDAGHQDGWHYLVMEHLDGLDLGRLAGRIGPLEVADACELVRQAALGLSHVHAHGLVHRDVKPSNLLLTRKGIVKLLDLGLVLSGDDPLAVDDRLTTVGHLMGTMPYMAPEQLMDSRDVDSRADIYALGATLFRLIAGRPPHRNERGLAKQVMAITSEAAPRLDTLRADVSKDVVHLVAEMLSRDPAARPLSARDVADRLAPLCENHAVKPLLRRALQKPPVGEPQCRIAPVAGRVGEASEGSAAGRNRVRSDSPGDSNRIWRILGGAACLLLLSGFFIKVATDRGDLIVQSEHDDLVVAVKRGEQVVSRLQVEADEENRVTLRKGSYVLEIENAPPGLTLDDNTVTIGRGKESQVAIKHQGSGRGQSARDESLRPTEMTNAMRGRGGLPERRYAGKPFGEWLAVLRSDAEVPALGKAMVAAVTLSEPGGSRQSLAAEAILVAARRFGGSRGRPTPPRGSNRKAISDSEHFMWYFQETLPDLQFSYLIQPLIQEIGAGNGRSRIACLYALDQQGWHSIERKSRNAEGRMELSELLGHCASFLLASEQPPLFAGVAPEEQRWGTEVAYRWAIRLAWLRDVDPLSLPGVKQRFEARAESALTVEEQILAYERTSQSTTQDRDQLRERISAAAGQDLELAKFQIGLVRKASLHLDEAAERQDAQAWGVGHPATAPQGSKHEPLYQGKDLASWRNLLVREQDPRALGEVLRAVELLTRGRPSRAQVAAETIVTARQWGGSSWSSTGDSHPTLGAYEDPSHKYMAYLHEVFPKYFPDVGLRTIVRELEEGNKRSRTACILLLQTTRALGDCQDPELRRSLYEGLRDAVESMSQDNPHEWAVTTGSSLGLTLRTSLDLPVKGESWLEKSVKARFREAIEVGDSPQPGMGGLGSYQPPISQAEMLAISEFDETEEFQIPWSFMAAHIVSDQYYAMPGSDDLFERIAEQVPDQLRRAIEIRLISLRATEIPQGSAAHAFQPGGSGLGGYGGGVMRPYHPLKPLATADSIWAKALPFYATGRADPAQARTLLRDLRGRMEGLDENNPTAFAAIDRALEVLSQTES